MTPPSLSGRLDGLELAFHSRRNTIRDPAFGAPYEIDSRPSMYGRSAAGMVTEPSFSWQFSRIATSVRPTASPDPFSVWTNSALPVPPAGT